MKSRNLATCSFVGVNSKVNIHSQQVTIHNIIYWKHKWNLRALSPIFLVYNSCNVYHWPERKNYVNLRKKPRLCLTYLKDNLTYFLGFCKQEQSHIGKSCSYDVNWMELTWRFAPIFMLTLKLPLEYWRWTFIWLFWGNSLVFIRFLVDGLNNFSALNIFKTKQIRHQ